MDKEVNTEGNGINVKLISTGSAVLAAVYQYSLIQKSTPKMSMNKKLGWCSGAAFICYSMTKLMLNNINQL